MINIIFEDNHLLVVEKPVNMPVQADDTKDADLLTLLKKYIKEKYNKPDNVYLGLVHRLDRPVGGVMVFAKTSKAASRLSEQIRNKLIKKEYHAVILGKINNKGKLIDRLLKDEKTNIVSVNQKGKEAILEYEVITSNQQYSLVKIDLQSGRSHQIRVQFASRNHPLYGDQKYNSHAIKHTQIALYANKLSFYHPVTKEWLTFELALPTCKPWNLF